VKYPNVKRGQLRWCGGPLGRELNGTTAIEVGTQALIETVGAHRGEACVKEQLVNHCTKGGEKGIGCRGETAMTPYHVGENASVFEWRLKNNLCRLKVHFLNT